MRLTWITIATGTSACEPPGGDCAPGVHATSIVMRHARTKPCGVLMRRMVPDDAETPMKLWLRRSVRSHERHDRARLDRTHREQPRVEVGDAEPVPERAHLRLPLSRDRIEPDEVRRELIVRHLEAMRLVHGLCAVLKRFVLEEIDALRLREVARVILGVDDRVRVLAQAPLELEELQTRIVIAVA